MLTSEQNSAVLVIDKCAAAAVMTRAEHQAVVAALNYLIAELNRFQPDPAAPAATPAVKK